MKKLSGARAITSTPGSENISVPKYNPIAKHRAPIPPTSVQIGACLLYLSVVLFLLLTL